MAENFDLIFGQNASQQYAWSDNDYQNGWETVGNIPPTAAQFDALQRRSDTKMKELNDELTPLVNANTTDNRQPATEYSVGTIKYTPLLPTGWFLECTVAGITSAGEIVLPTTPAEKDTVVDGTVTWTIRKMGSGSGGDGVPLGAIIAYSANGDLPSGYILCDGSAVSRTMFPDLFNAIGTTYGAGDGSTTFNVPDYNSAKRFVQGDTVAGTVKAAGLPNITGSIDFLNGLVSGGSIATTTGAITQFAGSSTGAANGGTNTHTKGFDFDASLSSSVYGNSTTVQPDALTSRYVIKAFDGQTADSALIDITQYANELANKATRALDNLSADGENHFLEQDFTIIYPNSGSESSPATITNHARYVETNPFPGYYVNCVAELLINNQWGRTGYTSGSLVAGTSANQLNDDAIVIQTGDYVITNSAVDGNPFDIATSPQSAPCRVKVWKTGKIPTA